MKAAVKYEEPRVSEITLTLDRHEHEILMATLKSHMNNEIFNGKVMNCGCAASIYEKIENAIASALENGGN